MLWQAKMAEDLLVLDRGHSLSSEYVELLSCSMAPLTCKASNVALSDQSPVIQLLDNMIQAALVQPSISLRTSMSCVQVSNTPNGNII